MLRIEISGIGAAGKTTVGNLITQALLDAGYNVSYQHFDEKKARKVKPGKDPLALAAKLVDCRELNASEGREVVVAEKIGQ